MLRLNRTGSGPGRLTVPVTKWRPGSTSRSSPWLCAGGWGRGVCAIAAHLTSTVVAPGRRGALGARVLVDIGAQVVAVDLRLELLAAREVAVAVDQALDDVGVRGLELLLERPRDALGVVAAGADRARAVGSERDDRAGVAVHLDAVGVTAADGDVPRGAAVAAVATGALAAVEHQLDDRGMALAQAAGVLVELLPVVVDLAAQLARLVAMLGVLVDHARQQLLRIALD